MKQTKFPNLLIVGAAKCGTTSLHNYLSQHPEVFMSALKEPKYFSSQVVNFPFRGPGDNIVESQICKTRQDYLNLFPETNKYKIVGESSADNLYYHKDVVPRIKETLEDDIKIIILLRNPVHRAFSAYMHMRRDLRDPEEDFAKALEKEAGRIENNFEFIWHYKHAGLYYESVKDYLENFKNVKIILSETLQQEKEHTLKEVCEFLNIDANYTFNLEQSYNKSGEIKNKFFQKILTSKTPLKRKIGQLVPQKFKTYFKFKNLRKTQILDKDKEALIKYYEEDILKLEKLIDKDLSSWLK